VGSLFVLRGNVFQSEFGFRYDDDVRLWTIDLDQAIALENLISKHALDAPERNVLPEVNDGPAADKALTGLASRSPKQESLLQDIKKSKGSNFTNRLACCPTAEVLLHFTFRADVRHGVD
jgi:hypothetical protein